MDEKMEKQEIYTIGNKKYNVIVRVTEQKLSKEKLIKLVAKYGLKQLQSENL